MRINVQLNSTNFFKKTPFVHVNIGLLASDVGESPSNTLDGGHSEHYLLLPIHVGVQHTQNVLEILVRHQRLQHNTAQHTKKTNSVTD